MLNPCSSIATTPATIYFPAGTYLISSSIFDFYYTNLIGNPNSRPIIKATANFAGFGLIDGNPYFTQDQNWLSTTVFWRQVRNFVFDLTAIPAASPATGIHWPTAQATSIQFVEFRMSTAPGVQAVGLFIENGITTTAFLFSTNSMLQVLPVWLWMWSLMAVKSVFNLVINSLLCEIWFSTIASRQSSKYGTGVGHGREFLSTTAK